MFAALLAVGCTLGCSKEELGPPEAELTGAWGAVSIEFVGKDGQGADISLDGGDLRLTGFDAAYDFNADGTEEPAKLNLVLRK